MSLGAASSNFCWIVEAGNPLPAGAERLIE